MTDPPTPSRVGARTEAAVASALARAGYRIFLPAFGADSRIDLDLAYERDGALVGVQCKTGTRVSDALRFWTSSNTGNAPASYAGQIDEFGVYSPDTNHVYLVPVGQTPRRACFLRLSPTKNGQSRGVRWADHYLLGPP